MSKCLIFVILSPTSSLWCRPGQIPARRPHVARQATYCWPRTFFQANKTLKIPFKCLFCQNELLKAHFFSKVKSNRPILYLNWPAYTNFVSNVSHESKRVVNPCSNEMIYLNELKRTFGQ